MAPALQSAPFQGEAFAAYLAAQEEKSLLRFLTCGSVDDGKSTLIGRLLYDSKLLFEDQLAALRQDSARHGTAGGDMDFALLVDGLEAEREQGITIDVAYRFFTTDKRKFIVADTPGHEQYTRNMATGASHCDAAVILVDARKGLLAQTRRHSIIVSLLGIRHVILAVNKIDLVNFSQSVFDDIVTQYRAFARDLNFASIVEIPISARFGDNVSAHGERMLWYFGPTLLQHLESLPVEEPALAGAFRMGVQWVNRPHLDFRGFSGTIAAGRVKPGDSIAVARSGRMARVARIVTMDGDLAEARAGQAVTLTLDAEIDISRGDILAAADARPQIGDHVAAHIIWMDDKPLLPGRSYLLKCGGASVRAQISALDYKINVNNFDKLAAKTLDLNEVAFCNIALAQPLAFAPYDENRELGSFILIDRMSNATVAAGMIRHALRRATNVHWQALDVNKAARAAAKGQRPCVLWFTGLSGAGKSTIANLVERKLHGEGKHTYLLDGDNMRHGLNRDLGFSDADRVENIRRAGETAKLFVDAGLIVLASFISPFSAERRMAREAMAEGEFIEIFVDAPLETCIERDPKGLYKKALAGEIAAFTGVNSAYEAPRQPELRVDTARRGPEEIADEIVAYLAEKGYLAG